MKLVQKTYDKYMVFIYSVTSNYHVDTKKGIRIPPGILQGAKVLVKATSRDDLPNKPQLTTCQL